MPLSCDFTLGSLITPGGIATQPGGPGRPAPDRRSSPLEGSQLGLVGAVPAVGEVAHHPWRDRNVGHPLLLRESMQVAHHPWRDRNMYPPTRSCRPRASLITPGGIATHRRGRRPRRPARVAHHPWRDRNSSTPLRCHAHPRRSSPLEGSQRGRQEPGGFAADRRSSPLEGSQHLSDQVSGEQRYGRSSPLEGSQRPGDGPYSTLYAVAHHPWRDRNPSALTASGCTSPGSLITPGGIATPPG